MNLFMVLKYPHPTLKAICDPVEVEQIKNKKFKKNIQSLIDTMYYKKGVGLSAPQVGLTIRLFVMDTNPDWVKPTRGIRRKPVVCINPTWEPFDEEKVPSDEGCLSQPETPRRIIARYKRINVTYVNQDGETKNEQLEGLSAFVFQHETDHLNGINYTDYPEMEIKKEEKQKDGNIS